MTSPKNLFPEPETVPEWRPDWDAFSAFVERLRHEHAARDEAEGIARTLAAFATWGVRPPSGFLKHAEAVAACRPRD